MPARIDPDLALDIAKATADAYADATEELTAAVARQVRRGDYDPDGWAARKLAETRQLQEQADRIVTQLAAQTPGLVDTAVTTAYTAGRGVAIATHTRAVDRLVAEATTRVMSTHGQILRSIDDQYRDIVTRTSLLVDTGTLSVDAAVRKTLDDFAKQGVTGFVDRAGRRWRLDRYAEMAVRTASGRAHVAGTLDQIQETGGALVIVSNHAGSCEVCEPWEGKVLTIAAGGPGGTVEDGDGAQVPIAGSVADAQAAGFQHPNCKHALTRFVEGLTVAPGPPPDDQEAVERRREANRRDEQERLRRRRQAVRTGRPPKPRV